jgi:hypothetical protein
MCLSTMYKTLTGIIAKEFHHIWKNTIYYQHREKCCHSGSKGCKDQLLILKQCLRTAKKDAKI